MFWAISQLHEHTIRAALDQGRFTPYLPGHPEVPAQAQAAAGFTVEGYYADRLSIGVKNDVVIIPVTGTMSRGWGYDNYFSNSFLIRLFASIADNDAKKGVILDFNSGGGTVDSTDEVNAGIAALAQRKPVVSLVSFCASAALWSAAPSNEIMMRPGPTVQIGSIGTMYIHTNYAKALEKQGYEPTIFRSTGSVDKAKPNGIEPLDAKTIADIQAGLDISNRVFKGAMRAGRGSKITSEEIYTGKLYGAKDAIRLGLADSIGNTQAAYQKVISLSKSYV